MRTINTHPQNVVRFTDHAKRMCEEIHLYRFRNPSHTVQQCAEHFGVSATSINRYFSGVHHTNKWGKLTGKVITYCYGDYHTREPHVSETRVRLGACLPINLKDRI